MTRGTTPTIRWNLGEADASKVSEAYMTIQGITGKQLEKDKTEMLIADEHKVAWKLTQEETLMFSGKVEIQLRYKIGDSAGASQTYRLDLNRILKKGEI